MMERARDEWDDVYDEPDMQEAARKLRPIEKKTRPTAIGASFHPGGAKRHILVDPVNPDVTVDELRHVFSESGEFFDRGAPVRVVQDNIQGGAVAMKMDPDAILLAAHRLARPFSIN